MDLFWFKDHLILSIFSNIGASNKRCGNGIEVLEYTERCAWENLRFQLGFFQEFIIVGMLQCKGGDLSMQGDMGIYLLFYVTLREG